MTLSQLHEVSQIESEIADLHNRLMVLYKKRESIFVKGDRKNATNRKRTPRKKSINEILNAREIDLTLTD